MNTQKPFGLMLLFGWLLAVVGPGFAQTVDFVQSDNMVLNPPAKILNYFGTRDQRSCQQACASDPNCKAYTFVKPGGYRAGDPPVCYLMSSLGPQGRNSCCISGLKKVNGGTNTNGVGAACNAFEGIWNTNYTPITFQRVGNQVTGRFIFQGVEGSVSGTLSNSILKGKWFQPTYFDPKYRSGQVEFVLNADGKSWSGKWWDANGAYGGDWNGSCAGKANNAGGVGGSSGRTMNQAPSLTRILVTRETLSNGRVSTVRPLSNANPMGLRAVAGFGNPDTGVPGLLTTIKSQPNPLRISLDLNQDGRVDETEKPLNPIVVAAAALPTCFTLVVAEGLSDPDGDPMGTRWDYIGTRFSSGNLYAAVNIPSANIFAGMELSTEAQLKAYTANSIIYEAPDYGLSLGSVVFTKGTGTVRAQAFDAPPTPFEPRLSKQVTSPEIEYAKSVKVEIVVASMCEQPNGSFKLQLQAKTFGFDPLGFTWFRWAYDGNGLDLVHDVPASNLVTFHLPAREKGQRVNVYVAASSKGPSSVNPNPFVRQPPEQFVTGMTFATVGSAVATMNTLTITDQGGCREICADGLDNDNDGKIDEDCNFRLYVHDNKCADDTIGVSVDGRDLGMTPTGKGRYFDISQLKSGEHTLVITAIASGGQLFGCGANLAVTYGLEVLDGVRLTQKNGTAFNGMRDEGEIQVWTRVIYRIVVP